MQSFVGNHLSKWQGASSTFCCMPCPSGCVSKEGNILSCNFQLSLCNILLTFMAWCSLLLCCHPSNLFLIVAQVKDTMRLLGVIKSLPAVTSRIGVGGAASSWVIKEFVAQIHTVSKVALHRKLNLASFLENHGRNSTSALILYRTPCLIFVISYYSK